MSIEINELNIRYKYKLKRICSRSFILISFFKKYMIMKYKPNKTVFINETLEPIIIR